MSRLLSPLRDPGAATALRLALGHIVLAILFPLGLAFSSVPFTDEGVEVVARHPMVPVVHAIAALLLFVGVRAEKVRGIAAVTTISAWFSFSALLGLSARLRQPPLGLMGCVMAFVIALFALRLVRSWGMPEDPEE